MDRQRFVFGAGQLHRLLSPRRRQDILAQARDQGFSAFDVAPAYGNGLCETELGIAFRRCRDSVRIATKFGIPVPYYGSRFRRAFIAIRILDKTLNPRYATNLARRDFSRAELVRSVHASLRRLGTDYIDTLFLHEPVQRVIPQQWDEILTEVDKLRQRGDIRQFGIAGRLAPMQELLGSPAVDFIQAPLGDIRNLQDSISAVPVAYGVYRTHAAEAPGSQVFEEFLRDAGESLPRCHFILSTTRPATLRKLGQLLQ